MRNTTAGWIAITSLLLLPACGGGNVRDLRLADAVITQQGCDGVFIASVEVTNSSDDDVRAQIDVLQRDNVAGVSATPSGTSTYRSRRTAPIRFDGTLQDRCDDGRIRYVLSGGNRSTPLNDVDVTSVIDGRAPDGNAGADPATGRFSYDLAYTCCGVGFANPYELTAISQDNTTDLVVAPETFACTGVEIRTVTVTGRLVDTRRNGLVRVRIEDVARDVSCSLDETVVLLREEVP